MDDPTGRPYQQPRMRASSSATARTRPAPGPGEDRHALRGKKLRSRAPRGELVRPLGRFPARQPQLGPKGVTLLVGVSLGPWDSLGGPARVPQRSEACHRVIAPKRMHIKKTTHSLSSDLVDTRELSTGHPLAASA